MHIEHSAFHDQLVRGLTHKMNNILSLFHGYLGLLLENKKLDSAILDGLARIKEGAHAASELMDRTQALARPSSVIWREINLAEFLRILKPGLEAHFKRGVKLRIVCPDDLPRLWADVSRLRTIVTELVRNAGDASPADSEVVVEATEEAQLGFARSAAVKPVTWVSLSVTDQGPGIGPEVGPRIFEPFFTTKQDEHATGLGLTVALGLVQQLGGVIRFESKPGHTVFRLLMPSRQDRF